MSEWGRIGVREQLYVSHSEAPPVEGWRRIGTRQSLYVSKPIVSPPVPPIPPIPPVGEKKFPWVPILIGGGALVAIAGLASAKEG